MPQCRNPIRYLQPSYSKDVWRERKATDGPSVAQSCKTARRHSEEGGNCREMTALDRQQRKALMENYILQWMDEARHSQQACPGIRLTFVDEEILTEKHIQKPYCQA